ncbi:MAG: DUF2911 domain-containing protein [Flammeovirgaceae bacterium]
MKKLFITLLIIGGIIGAGSIAFKLFIMNTKKYSPEAMATYNKNGVSLKVEYCQPSKKNRKIFGGLVPFNEVWRTGANEATLFRTNQDLVFGDQLLEAGAYSLFTLPTESDWEVIFNGETGQWGTQYNEAEDVMRVPAATAVSDNMVESFTIRFDDADGQLKMLLTWDQTVVTLPIEVE